MSTILNTPLNVEIIQSLHPEKVFSSKENEAKTPISSIYHTFSGNHFITTLPNGTLNLYQTSRPKLAKTTYSKKYGCTSATFTGRGSDGSTPQSCIVASSIPNSTSDMKSNHAIRLLDLNTNSFSKYFNGHIDQVISLWGAPWMSEGFCSSSIDGTIKIWDQRSNSEISSLNLNCKSEIVIGCDPSGQVMAIWEPKNGDLIGTLTLVPTFDFPEGFIGKLDIFRSDLSPNSHRDFRVESIKFNANGLLVLGFVNQDLIVIDSLNLKIKSKLIGRSKFPMIENDIWRSTGSIEFSWDGNWLFAGSGDENLIIWDLKSSSSSSIIKPFKTIPTPNHLPRLISINPKFGTLVTCDTDLMLHNIY